LLYARHACSVGCAPPWPGTQAGRWPHRRARRRPAGHRGRERRRRESTGAVRRARRDGTGGARREQGRDVLAVLPVRIAAGGTCSNACSHERWERAWTLRRLPDVLIRDVLSGGGAGGRRGVIGVGKTIGMASSGGGGGGAA
jgi:hypothetical protein